MNKTKGKMKLRTKYIYMILAALGMLGSLAFPPYGQIWILFIALSALMHVLNQTVSKKHAALMAGTFGFGFGAVSMSWLIEALMIDGARFAWVIPFMLVGCGLFFGAFYALPAWGAMYAHAGWRRWLAFAALFAIFEWVRGWLIFGGLPWNLLGTVWVNVPAALQVAGVAGVYGLSLFSMLLFSVFALYKNKKLVVCVLAAAVFLGALGFMRLYAAENRVEMGVKLRLVQPNIPQTLKWDPVKQDEHFSKLIRLSRTDNQNITHVIWPESAVSFIVNYHEADRLRLMSAVRQGSFLIMGAMRQTTPGARNLANSVVVLNDLADIVAYYDKVHLVPFGEYAPLRGILPIDRLVPFESDFDRGDGVKTMHVPKTVPASPLVCYEIIFPRAVVDESRRPGWIINVTNDAWFGISAGPYQHYAAAVLRAVEEGLPVVRVANHGISGVIDPYGRTLKYMGLGAEGVLDADLPSAISMPIYARFGNWVWGVLAVVMLGVAFGRRNLR